MTKNSVQHTYWETIKDGKIYHKKIQRELTAWWPHIFGQFALKIGHFSHEIDARQSHIEHLFSLSDSNRSQSSIIAEHHELPIHGKSIDLCVACNLLEFSVYPQQIMHEIDRVLVDDGWLVLTHINLFSLLGIQLLRHKLTNKNLALRNKTPHNKKINNNKTINLKSRLPNVCNVYSARTINEWLRLLNYEIIHSITLNQKFEKESESKEAMNRPAINQMLGGIRLVIARKRTIPLTHIKNQKKSAHRRTQLIANPLSEGVQQTNKTSKTQSTYKKRAINI